MFARLFVCWIVVVALLWLCVLVCWSGVGLIDQCVCVDLLARLFAGLLIFSCE